MKLVRKLAGWGALVGISTSLLLLLAVSRSESKAEGDLIIMATASGRGEVTPCG